MHQVETAERIQAWLRDTSGGPRAVTSDRPYAYPAELTDQRLNANEVGSLINCTGKTIRDLARETYADDIPADCYALLKNLKSEIPTKGKIFKLEDGKRIAIINRGGKGRGNETTFAIVEPGGTSASFWIPDYITH